MSILLFHGVKCICIGMETFPKIFSDLHIIYPPQVFDDKKQTEKFLNKHIPFLLGSARIKHSSLLYFSHSNEEPSTTYKYATHGKYRVIIISGEISSSTEQSHTPSPSRPCNHFSGRLISF